MRNSVFKEMRERGSTLKINCSGFNYASISELMRNSEVFTNEVTGDVTINEIVKSNRISAIVAPLDRQEALRKAIFNSVLMTTSYRAGKAVSTPTLACEQTHFALNQSTNAQVMDDYLSWFVSLNLLTEVEKAAILGTFVDSGGSTCIVRTSFTDAECRTTFFDAQDKLRGHNDYLEIGRMALRALVDPAHQSIDKLRYRILDDPLWPKARDIGANGNLGPLVGLNTNDPRVQYLVGDVFVVMNWADGMVAAGKAVLEMRRFVESAGSAFLAESNEFNESAKPFKKPSSPWWRPARCASTSLGVWCAFIGLGGSPPTAYGKAHIENLLVERGQLSA